MSHVSLRCALPIAAVLILAAVSLSIGDERTYRSTPEGEGALTQAMIEHCVASKQEIDKQLAAFKEIEAQYNVLDKEIDELKAFFDALEAQKTFDPSDSKELDAYNGRVGVYKSKLAEKKKLYEEMTAKKAAYDQQIVQFDRECKDQPYYEDDHTRAVDSVK